MSRSAQPIPCGLALALEHGGGAFYGHRLLHVAYLKDDVHGLDRSRLNFDPGHYYLSVATDRVALVRSLMIVTVAFGTTASLLSRTTLRRSPLHGLAKHRDCGEQAQHQLDRDRDLCYSIRRLVYNIVQNC